MKKLNSFKRTLAITLAVLLILGAMPIALAEYGQSENQTYTEEAAGQGQYIEPEAPLTEDEPGIAAAGFGYVTIAPLSTRTTPLDFVANPAPDSNALEGWDWDGTTLTLDGLDLAVTTGTAIRLPSGAAIVLVGPNNSVSSTAGDAISGGFLTISGSGAIDIEAGWNGISVTEVTITGGDITIDASDFGISSSTNINISGGANVAVVAGWNGLYADSGDITIGGAGTVVNVQGGISTSAIFALGTFSVAAGATLYVTVGSSFDLANVIAGLDAGATVTIQLTADITHNQQMTIVTGANVTVTSGSGPYTITRASGFTNYLFNVDAGTLTLENIILDGNNVANSGALVNVWGGTFVMNAGTTLQNNTRAVGDYGGGVFVGGGGTFTMNDGAISGNYAYIGGGVGMSGGTFTMNGGTISGNTTGNHGGGVALSSGTFTMNGGEISGNTAGTEGGGVDIDGGGVFVMNDGEISGNTAGTGGGGVSVIFGTFTMNGGAIIDNTAILDGGGVLVYSTFILGGNSEIIDNTVGGSANNVYLASGRFITLGTDENAPTAYMFVGVHTDTPSGVIVQSGAVPANAGNFTVDAPAGYVVAWNTDGELVIVPVEDTAAITYNANGGAGAMPVNRMVSGLDYTVSANGFTSAGYTFTGWNTAADGTGTAFEPGDEILDVTEDITLFAQWQIIPTPPGGGWLPPPIVSTAPTDPPEDVTEEPAVQNPFEDVFEDDWFFDAVLYAWVNDLMVGTSTEPMLFAPNSTLTRGMVVTVLHRHAGSPDVTGLSNPFDDVAAGRWYADAVIWAADRGIVQGVGGGRFAPGASITRQDLVVMLANYADFAGMTLPVVREYPGFLDDADIADYAKEAIEQFFRAMVVSGRPGNVFDPQGAATRAEFAEMLMNFLEAAE